MATLPIHLVVEDVAVGPVLIALRKMPGIIKLDLDLLSDAPTPSPAKVPGGPSIRELIIAALVKAHGGPLALKDICQGTGIGKSSVHGGLNYLSKQHLAVSKERGFWQLTDKARRELLGETIKALPAPAKAKGNGKAKAPPGVGRKRLLGTLQDGGLTRAEVRERLRDLTTKAVANLIDRAKHDGLLKKVGDKYELSASGKKRVVGASAAEPATETTTQGD